MMSQCGLIINQSADSLFDCVPFASPLDGETSKDTIIEGYQKLIDRYAGTQVSHIFLNVNFQRAAYRSEVWDSYWDNENPETSLTEWPKKSWLVYKKGVNPYAICISHCREKGISPWISVRMNDTHYIDDRTKVSTFWWNHPEYRRTPNSGLDFAIEEVRDYYMALLLELLERYDVDGLELDWMRFPYHFKPGKEEQGLEILKEFTRQVRKQVDQWAITRGHPIGIAARVPSVPRFAIGFGLDGAAWVREGLIDILVPSALWRPTDTDIPIEAWRKLIGPVTHEYILAAGADLWIQCCPDGILMMDNLDSARGFTAAMLDRGADQIYLFNHFYPLNFRQRFVRSDGSKVVRDEYHELLNQTARLDTVIDKPRRHVITFRHPVPAGIRKLTQLPADISKNRTATFRVYTGPKPSTGCVVIRAGLKNQCNVFQARLGARLNSAKCRPIKDLNRPGQFVSHKGSDSDVVWSVADVAPRVAQFEVPLVVIRRGYNTIELFVQQGSEQSIVWMEIYINPEILPSEKK